MICLHLPRAALAAALLTCSAAALAQDASPAAATPPADSASTSTARESAGAAQCELHVWPGRNPTAVTTGLLSGFGVVGALADLALNDERNRSDAALLARGLSPAAQADALAEMDLAALVGLPGARVVLEEEPLDPKTIHSIKHRRTASKSPCYSELFVRNIFYQKAAMYGRSLRVHFTYRPFGSGDTVATVLKGNGGNGLKLFPAKEAADDAAAAAELVSVFKANFVEFAREKRLIPAAGKRASR